jgi:microcystin degradation protein MlrC
MIDEALDRALAVKSGPVVIADTADNTGGGAPGDSTFLLRRVRKRGIKDVGIAPLRDPIAVQFCRDAGVDATLDLSVPGHKFCKKINQAGSVAYSANHCRIF